MTYRNRLSVLVLIDSLIILIAIFVSNFFLYPNVKDLPYSILVTSALVLLLSHHLFSGLHKLYNKAWQYASIGELMAIFKAVTYSILVTAAVQAVVFQNVFIRTLFITWMLHILLIGGSRFAWRMFRDTFISSAVNQSKKRTLIVGAGAAGTMVARQLMQNPDAELLPMAFVDDDKRKHRLEIMGIPVAGSVASIEQAVKDYQVDNIVIAIPSLSKKELSVIFNECKKTEAKTKIMPMIEDLMVGKVSVQEFRDVQVEDLLGRDPVELDIHTISEYITGNTVMVTGAGGSIGSEICRQIMRFAPRKIVLVGHGEFSIYTIDMELKEQYADSEVDIEIVPVIADVQDRERIFEVMHTHKPTIIYHAAAHKHVPLMEYNPHEAVKNNILGTKNVAEAADAFGINKFVLVSTDKAVNPTNVMGATKRVAEMVIQDLAQHSKTKFVAVRFGNVLGSRGSVIPLFKKQIEKGGPITVTHEDMTRYFMTIPEASRLVIQAGTLAKGGEIFVLDMGEPVKIADLARNLIKLSGYTEEEIPVAFSGIRPGEKMYEELLGEDEVLPGEVYEKIYVGRTVEVDANQLVTLIDRFHTYDAVELKDELMGIVYAERELLTVQES